MSLHHERQRAQHGHPLHRDHTEHLETGIASAVREIDEMRAENERLRAENARLLDMLNRANAAEAEASVRLESIRAYAKHLWEMARQYESVHAPYLAHVYATISRTLERKIGDRT